MKQLFLYLLMGFVAGTAIAQQIQRPEITGISYVALQVSNVDSAAKFYGNYLGYPLIRGKNSFGIQVNARQWISIKGGLPREKDERLLTVAFQTSDLRAMKEYLVQKGMQIQYEPEKLGIRVEDPDGHEIIFTELPLKKAVATPGISDRILHVGLTVADPIRADSFYAAILGFSEIWRGGATDSVTSWINMRLPESTDYIEYMLVKSPVNRRQLGSAHHIALMVPDMQKAVDALRLRAGNVPSPRIGRNNRWLLNLFDADGTRVELMEPFTAR